MKYLFYLALIFAAYPAFADCGLFNIESTNIVVRWNKQGEFLDSVVDLSDCSDQEIIYAYSNVEEYVLAPTFDRILSELSKRNLHPAPPAVKPIQILRRDGTCPEPGEKGYPDC